MNRSSSDFPAVIPAATLVIFRNGPAGGAPELLMVQRAQEMRFAGGAAVFPGGRIDAADHALAQCLAQDGDSDELAARIAAIRETLEETGLVIGLNHPVSAQQAAEARGHLLECGELAPVAERFGWTLAPDRLVPFARWCPQRDRAFDTRFYLADLGTGAVDIAVDATENTRLFWSSAVDSLGMADRDAIRIIFPTRCNLERLALFSSFEEARAHSLAIPVQTISPAQMERDGEMWLTIPEGLGYPVTSQPMSMVRRA